MKDRQQDSPPSRQSSGTVMTSTQAAAMLQVHESSIKRWSNQGDLAFTKTSGGHRRFSVKALQAFAEERGQSYPLAQFGESAQELGEALLASWTAGSLAPMRDLLRPWLRTELREQYPSIFHVLYKDYEFPLWQLFDELICGLMFDMGQEWQDGRLPVAEEHLISQVVLTGMQRLAEEVKLLQVDQEPVGTAITAGAEGSLHEIGAFCVRLLLEEKGWRTLYPGANLPTSELGALQQEYGASLVCLSFVKPQRLSDLHRSLEALKKMYQPDKPYTLVVGGSALVELGSSDHVVEQWLENASPFEGLYKLDSLGDFTKWLSKDTGRKH